MSGSRRQPSIQAAFFDVDGTLVDTTILHYYFWYIGDCLPLVGRGLRRAKILLAAPYYWILDKRSRTAFTYAFYRNYAGLVAADFEAWCRERLGTYLRPRIYPGAKRELAALRSRQVPVVLVTGSLAVLVRPFEELVNLSGVLATTLEVSDGAYTGSIAGLPMAGEEKLRRLTAYAQERGLDLRHCAAYGDSISDLPMLESVGHPVAVNPTARLAQHARQHQWQIEQWR